MQSILLCLVVSIAALVAGRRSLVAGLCVVFATGYAYGIVRANLLQTGSHFLFDAAVGGLYLARLTARRDERLQPVPRVLLWWVLALIAWPFLLLAWPKQDLMVQVVGLRGNAFLLPFLLLGAQLDDEQRYQLALFCAALNLVAFGFALAEFQLGIPAFFPRNAVTTIIYASTDVGSERAYRIPSTFGSAHAFGGTMVVTLPLMLGAWLQHRSPARHKALLFVSVLAASVGVFMSAARSHSVLLFVFLAFATFGARMTLAVRSAWVVLIAGLTYAVLSNERLQRFTTLGDTQYLGTRLDGSVNTNFLDYALDYPMGNGLGGGGTSMPYFLADRLQNPVLLENEYARIMLEQGIPGLLLWVVFLTWLLTRTSRIADRGWRNARLLAWCVVAMSCISSLIGVGMLTSIPQSAFLLMLSGWMAAAAPVDALEHDGYTRARRLTGAPVPVEQ